MKWKLLRFWLGTILTEQIDGNYDICFQENKDPIYPLISPSNREERRVRASST